MKGNGTTPSVAGSDAANNSKKAKGGTGEKPTKPKAKAAKKSKPSKGKTTKEAWWFFNHVILFLGILHECVDQHVPGKSLADWVAAQRYLSFFYKWERLPNALELQHLIPLFFWGACYSPASALYRHLSTSEMP